MSQQEIIREINDNKSVEKRYVRAITKGKKNNYLNVSIPTEISAKLQLTEKLFC
jgi:hypothetical protein